MKRTDFNELIEKAFSMGYECALEEVEEKIFSKDEDEEESISKIAKRRAIKGFLAGSFGGGIGGAIGGSHTGRTKDVLVGHAVGTIGGGIMGAGIGASSALLEKIKRNPNFKYVKEAIKDENKVRRGEMSNEEFFEKYPYLK